MYRSVAGDPSQPAFPEEMPQPMDPEMDPSFSPETPSYEPPEPAPGDWRPHD